MSTRKHSAGPWRHSDEDGQPILGKHRKFPICYMDTGDAINDADIRLICAAPELLKALLGLLEQVESLKGESSCIDADIMHGEEYRKACRAVSRATG